MRRLYFWILVILIIFGLGCASLSKIKSGQPIAVNKQEAFNSTAAQHFIRGSINELRGDYKSAHLEYSQALLYDTSSATIYNKVAEQYIRMKNIESAKKMLLQTRKRFPNNIVTHEILASIFFSERNWKKAEIELQKMLELDPFDIDSYYSLITTYLHQGKDLKVAEQYKKLIEIGYGSPEMQIKMGDIYLKNKQYKKSKEVFQDFYNNYPDDERSFLAMAKLAIAKKDTILAIDWYQKGIDKNINFDSCLEELRDLYIKQKEWDQAIILLKQIVAKDASKIVNYLRLGELYFRKGDTTIAIDQFKQATDFFPDDFRAHFSLGSINYQLGNMEPATQSLQKSIELNEKFERGWTLLGFIYIRNKDDEKQIYNKSDEMYQRALKLRPDDPLLMNNYSYSLSERGIKLNEAKSMSQKAVAADSTNGAYLDTLGWIHFKLGEYESALKYISKATKVRDSSAEVWEHLGDVYEKLSDMENAKIYWNKAIELDESRTWLLDKLEDK